MEGGFSQIQSHIAEDCALQPLLDTVQNHAARQIIYEWSLRPGYYEVDDILQGLYVTFKFGIPFLQKDLYNMFNDIHGQLYISNFKTTSCHNLILLELEVTSYFYKLLIL